MNAVDLDDLLAGPEPEWDETPVPPDGTEHANRLLRRLARVRREQATVDALAAAEYARVDAWHAGEAHRLDRQQEWLEQALAQYHRAVLARDPKAKTVSLPNGTLKARAQQPEWTFEDPDAFLAWAQANAPELVRQPDPPGPAIDKAATKQTMAANVVDGRLVVLGEIVPGVTVTDREAKYVAEVTP